MKLWEDQSHEDANILLARLKLYEPLGIPALFDRSFGLLFDVTDSSYVDITMWLKESGIFESERSTTASDEFYKTIIRFWQKRKISERFDVLAQREDNWDGYDSKKPTGFTLNCAKYLMEDLFDSIISAGHPWLTPFISSDEDGYITVEWHKGKRELHFDIQENEVEYTKIWGPSTEFLPPSTDGGETTMKIHIDFLNRDDYLMLWKWLLDG